MSQWINFAELRKQLVFKDVLASYNVNLEPKGKEQFVGTCPLPNHANAKGNTFSANFEKGLFQCFECHQRGNIIDLAVLMEGKDKKNGQEVRDVALQLQKRFVENRFDDAPRSGTKARKSIQPPVASAPEATRTISVVVNKPLDFELKTLETNHPFFSKHKLHPETVAHFGLGFSNRGSLAGKIAVPLQDDVGKLVGYAGLDLESDVPSYVFPLSRDRDSVKHVFDPGKFLYNGHRIGKAVKSLVVVRECHTVWQLFQGGAANVVALMENQCSADQTGLLMLLTSDTARISLFTDSSEESEETARSFFPELAACRLCRWIRVGSEEEIVADHPLLGVKKKR